MSRYIDKSLLRYVPKSKHVSISQMWRDEDGIWVILRPGWNADRTDMNCRTIHEDTIKDLRYQIAGIVKVKED